jgi:hypothetical protein
MRPMFSLLFGPNGFKLKYVKPSTYSAGVFYMEKNKGKIRARKHAGLGIEKVVN